MQIYHRTLILKWLRQNPHFRNDAGSSFRYDKWWAAFRNDVHFGIALSFRNEGGWPSFRKGDDNHLGMEFRFILDFLLDLWLIFSEWCDTIFSIWWGYLLFGMIRGALRDDFSSLWQAHSLISEVGGFTSYHNEK